MEQQLDKLTRGDIIKLVAAEALEQLAGEVAECERIVKDAHVAFNDRVAERAKSSHHELLRVLADACRFDPEDVVANVPRVVYAETTLPDSVAVGLTNSALPFEQRMRIEVRVPLQDVEDAANLLQRSLVDLAEAERRDHRVSSVKEKVRKDLVDELLKSGGADAEELLGAAKRLAKAIKNRLLES